MTKSIDGPSARAQVESWRGTPEELLSVLQALAAGVTHHMIVTTAEWIDGTRSRMSGLDALRAQLESAPSIRSLEMRVTTPKWNAAVRTQERVPGLAIEVHGTDTRQVVALADAAFSRAMIGYVDRLGGWRAPLCMAITMAVPLTWMWCANRYSIQWAALTYILAAAIWFAFSLLVIWPRMLASKGFVLVASIQRKVAVLTSTRERIRRSSSWVRNWALGSLSGVILVGLIVNGFYDFLLEHFPWFSELLSGTKLHK